MTVTLASSCADGPSTPTELSPDEPGMQITASNGVITATAVSPSKIVLKWKDFGSRNDSYRVQRMIDGRWKLIAALPADSTRYTDEGLSGGTKYTYRVRACNSKTSDCESAPRITLATPAGTDTEQARKIGSSSATSTGVLAAFPGAQGYGAEARGGRGGRVIFVTNLNDSGPGSLRECAEATGARTCIFKVAGVIRLRSSIRVCDGHLTIAGQTAPGGGITLAKDRSTTTINGLIALGDSDSACDVEDVIIRYLRFRPGGGADSYAAALAAVIDGKSTVRNVILDHNTFSWTPDNLVKFYRSADRVEEVPFTPLISNVTIQRALLAEPLTRADEGQGHATGMQINGSTRENSAGDPLRFCRQIVDIDLHHSAFVHSTHRNPVLSAGCESQRRGAKAVNTGSYNWASRNAESKHSSTGDWIGNYWKQGPNSDQDFFVHNDSGKEPTGPTSLYLSGNVGVDRSGRVVGRDREIHRNRYTGAPLPAKHYRDAPLPSGPFPIRVQPAAEAYASVITLDDAAIRRGEGVGANARLTCSGDWIPNIDSADRRVLRDVLNGTGSFIASVSQAGGYPDVERGKPCSDADRDGMPDEFEARYGLSERDATDAGADSDRDGYSNLEEYLNGTHPKG